MCNSSISDMAEQAALGDGALPNVAIKMVTESIAVAKVGHHPSPQNQRLLTAFSSRASVRGNQSKHDW